jgi:tetratricopeptide (TPR) repeat protein
VGDVLKVQGNLAEALKSYRAALAISEGLAKTDPSNAEWQRDLSLTYGRVASILAGQGETEQALVEYQKARSIVAWLKEQSPDDATLPKDLAWYDTEIAKLQQAPAGAPSGTQPEQAAR